MKFVSDLRQVNGFLQDSSTNKTDCHNNTEILLNMALSTINLTLYVCIKVFIQLQLLNGVFKLITPHLIETSFKFSARE
jgi:hypothetical protein